MQATRGAPEARGESARAAGEVRQRTQADARLQTGRRQQEQASARRQSARGEGKEVRFVAL